MAVPLWKILGWKYDDDGIVHVVVGEDGATMPAHVKYADARVTEPHLFDWLAEHSQAVGVWFEAGPEPRWVAESSVGGVHCCATDRDRRAAVESVFRQAHEAIGGGDA